MRSKYNRWSNVDVGGGWLFKVVPIFIGFVFLCIIAYWLFIGVIGVAVVKEVNKNGLKSIVERVWNGK